MKVPTYQVAAAWCRGYARGYATAVSVKDTTMAILMAICACAGAIGAVGLVAAAVFLKEWMA